MIGNHRRRIDRLEARYPAQPDPAGGIDPALQRAWLATLSDDDLEFMAGVAEYLEAGRSIDALPVSTRERMAAIMATWETFQASDDVPAG
jgi:hypothetical protein